MPTPCLSRLASPGGGLVYALILACDLLASTACTAEAKPLQVFILAGQSNMDGHARISSFDHIGMDPKTAPILRAMRSSDGSPRVCENVWISYFRGPEEGGEGFGNLTAGYGSRSNPTEAGDKIGPEFTFGIYIQQFLDAPILLIKTAWGGKSLHTDFRPPSAGPYVFNDQQQAEMTARGRDIEAIKAEKIQATGRYYRLMVEHVQQVLADIARVCPAYDPDQGYELAGLVWFQGWNDMVDRGVYPNRDQPGGYAQYTNVMTHFIRDIRKDLSAPDLHVVIGVLGVGGPVEAYAEAEKRYAGIHQEFRRAMAAPASLPEFEDNVTAVLTEAYWDPELDDVVQKRTELARKERALKEKSQDGSETRERLSPEAQEQRLEQYRAEIFTARDLEVLKGVTNAAYHYYGSAKILAQIGKAFAEAMAAGINP